MQLPLYFAGANANSVRRKIKHEKCDVRFLLRFTIQNAIAKNGKVELQSRNENVSKPSRLCIKVTCRCWRRRMEEAKTAKIAETFS